MAIVNGRIELRGLRCLVHIGVPVAERAVAQPVELDLDLEIDLSACARSDSVGDTADYGVVSSAVVDALTREPIHLLERAALLAAEACLASDPMVRAVDVAIRKLRPPVPQDIDTAGVRLRAEVDS